MADPSSPTARGTPHPAPRKPTSVVGPVAPVVVAGLGLATAVTAAAVVAGLRLAAATVVARLDVAGLAAPVVTRLRMTGLAATVVTRLA